MASEVKVCGLSADRFHQLRRCIRRLTYLQVYCALTKLFISPVGTAGTCTRTSGWSSRLLARLLIFQQGETRIQGVQQFQQLIEETEATSSE